MMPLASPEPCIPSGEIVGISPFDKERATRNHLIIADRPELRIADKQFRNSFDINSKIISDESFVNALTRHISVTNPNFSLMRRPTPDLMIKWKKLPKRNAIPLYESSQSIIDQEMLSECWNDDIDLRNLVRKMPNLDPKKRISLPAIMTFFTTKCYKCRNIEHPVRHLPECPSMMIHLKQKVVNGPNSHKANPRKVNFRALQRFPSSTA
jgi:serine/threonine protein kinase